MVVVGSREKTERLVVVVEESGLHNNWHRMLESGFPLLFQRISRDL